jgi:predicted transcriptional regulator
MDAACAQRLQTPIDGRCLGAYVFGVSSGPVRPPFLGDLETAVMNHLWAGGEGEAKAVHAALGKRRGITLNTVQSTLKRLFEKGLLERDKVSHAHVYRASVSREGFHQGLVGELVGDLMHGQAEAVVSAFVDLAERAGPEHLARLEALVAERRRKRGGGPA